MASGEPGSETRTVRTADGAAGAERSQSEDSYLREFGVEPGLKRVLGTITGALFGVAFQGPTAGSLLVATACFGVAGPAYIWAFPTVIILQLVVAVVWGEVVSHYPLTGGIYQWARYLGGAGAGWLTGVLYAAAMIIVMPAVGLVMSIVVSGLIPAIAFNPTNEVIISFLVMIATALIVTTSVRLVALINSVGVVMELLVLVGAAILLLFHTRQSPSVVFDTAGTGTGFGWLVGSFFLAVALLVTLLTGFETAGIFAEETVESRVKAPRSIISAAAGTGLVTWFFAFAVLMAVPSVPDAMKSPATLVPDVLNSAFGSIGSKIFLIGAFIAVSSTSIATLAAIVRTLYALARDGQLPGASYLVRLSKRTDEPLVTIMVATILCLLPLVAVTHIDLVIAAITGLLVLPYVIVLGALLVRRLNGWPHRPSLFNLGGWGLPLTVIALAWVVFVFVDTAWPRPATNPNWGPFPVIEEFIVALAVLAGIWWFAVLRTRPQATVHDPDANVSSQA